MDESRSQLLSENGSALCSPFLRRPYHDVNLFHSGAPLCLCLSLKDTGEKSTADFSELILLDNTVRADKN